MSDLRGNVEAVIAYLEAGDATPDVKGKWAKGYRQACADHVAVLRLVLDGEDAALYGHVAITDDATTGLCGKGRPPFTPDARLVCGACFAAMRELIQQQQDEVASIGMRLTMAQFGLILPRAKDEESK